MSYGIRQGKSIEEVAPEEADFILDSPDALTGSHVNTLPMVNNHAAPRSFYGARFVNQAQPLVNREIPLVTRVKESTGKSFDEHYGEACGALRSKIDGTVTRVTKNAIHFRTDAGEDHKVELADVLPFNRKSSLSHLPRVKAGDKVKKGDLLADSTFTKDGTMALGVNARIAMAAYKGASMDDATVISESFAKRLSSEHTYGFHQDYDDNVRHGKEHFSALFPHRFTKEQLDKLDENGLAKPGVTLNHGDPIMLATKPKTITSKIQVAGLHRGFRDMRSDAAQVWDGKTEAKVSDAVMHGGAGRVYITTVKPAQVADKLALRPGQKCFDDKTEILTETGWKLFKDLLPTDMVASLGSDGMGRFVKPLARIAYPYKGRMYGLAARRADYLVTPGHRVWRRDHVKTGRGYYCLDSQKVHGTAQVFMTAAPFDLSSRTPTPPTFSIPDAVSAKTKAPMGCQREFPTLPFVKLLGVYLAEGNIRHATFIEEDKATDYAVVLTQSEKAHPEQAAEIKRLLEACSLRYTYDGRQFIILSNKALSLWLKPLGKAADKHVPEFIKLADEATIRAFLEGLWLGDGDKTRNKSYFTSSVRLRDDVQHLFALLGETFVIHTRDAREHQNHDSHELYRQPGNETGTRDNYKHAYYVEENYDGWVYCVAVGGEGVVYTRRNGKTMWNGNCEISRIIPDDQMPRGEDGKPFEMLLNPLSLPSRVNDNTIYALSLGKIAAKTGKRYALPGFTKPGESRLQQVEAELQRHGINPKERVYDPTLGLWLDNPVHTGHEYVLRLHHLAGDKISHRGATGYDSDELPAKGGGEHAQAKRMSGLETASALSSGAYGLLNETASLRGQKNHDFWSAYRRGLATPKPGTPLVWHKFHALLGGAGLKARDMKGGKLRLGPMTERDLEQERPAEIRHPETIDLTSGAPVKGGLMDPVMSERRQWGKISLPFTMLNPAFESTAIKVLGLTERAYRDVLAGRAKLSEVRKH